MYSTWHQQYKAILIFFMFISQCLPQTPLTDSLLCLHFTVQWMLLWQEDKMYHWSLFIDKSNILNSINNTKYFCRYNYYYLSQLWPKYENENFVCISCTHFSFSRSWPLQLPFAQTHMVLNLFWLCIEIMSWTEPVWNKMLLTEESTK